MTGITMGITFPVLVPLDILTSPRTGGQVSVAGIFTSITFPVLVPFDMLTATRTSGQVFIAGITPGITFQVLIPFRTFRTLIDPVLTSRGLAVRF